MEPDEPLQLCVRNGPPERKQPRSWLGRQVRRVRRLTGKSVALVARGAQCAGHQGGEAAEKTADRLSAGISWVFGQNGNPRDKT